MEKDPIITTEQLKEKKDKRPLWKKMEELRQLGWFISEYKENEPSVDCQTDGCTEFAKWYIEGNSYCPRCMSAKFSEFKEAKNEEQG